MTSSTESSRRSAGRIDVLESDSHLAPELRRRFAGEEIVVQSCRVVRDLAVKSGPRVCILSVDRDLGSVAEFVQRVRDDRTTACAVVITADRGAELEWPLREMGVVSVVAPSIRGDELAALCRSLLKSRIINNWTSGNHV